jgi:hypothetical protein
VGSEMCIRDRFELDSRGGKQRLAQYRRYLELGGIDA